MAELPRTASLPYTASLSVRPTVRSGGGWWRSRDVQSVSRACPDLPSDFVSALQFMPWKGAELLRSDINSAPALLQNPPEIGAHAVWVTHRPDRPVILVILGMRRVRSELDKAGPTQIASKPKQPSPEGATDFIVSYRA